MVNPTVATYQKWYKEKLCGSDDCPTDPTLKTYAYSMAWLAKRMEGFDAETAMVPEPQKILDYMETNKVKNGRRVASYTALKVFHNCKKEQTCSKAYGVPLVMCSRQQQAEYAKQDWVRMASNMSLGAYEIFRAQGELPEPQWPRESFQQLLAIAFKKTIISSPDHIVLRQLAGEV